MSKHTPLLPAPKHRPLFFPQYHRFFPAPVFKHIVPVSIRVVLWIALIALVCANMLYWKPRFSLRRINSALTAVAKIPFATRFLPAYIFRGLSFNLAAQPNNVLGAETQSGDSSDTQSQYDRLIKQYDYWKSVIAQHPNYRDGYYMLATLSYQLGNYPDTRSYITRVQELDPNYPGIEVLSALLPKQ